jgi:hypothetical protein
MQDKVTYEYAVIRVMPKVERCEFFNVGVILFSKRKKFLDVKFHVDPKKLAAFTDEVDAQFLNDYLASWKSICEGSSAGGAIGQFELSDRFRWLAASRSTMIQSSKTHSGLCDNPAALLEDLFEKYVG